MSHLPTLIADLALILISAGIMTLLFKKLKQPLVLGYVMAGFLSSPHISFTPSVMDTANIQTWADIGVIFLLFALGLEFSFKKNSQGRGHGGYCCLYGDFLHDIAGHWRGHGIWLETNGLSLPRRNDCHVVNHHYLQGF